MLLAAMPSLDSVAFLSTYCFFLLLRLGQTKQLINRLLATQIYAN